MVGVDTIWDSTQVIDGHAVDKVAFEKMVDPSMVEHRLPAALDLGVPVEIRGVHRQPAAVSVDYEVTDVRLAHRCSHSEDLSDPFL